MIAPIDRMAIAAKATVSSSVSIAMNSTSNSAWASTELLRGQREVLIQHGTEMYRLRLTKQGKLILYK